MDGSQIGSWLGPDGPRLVTDRYHKMVREHVADGLHTDTNLFKIVSFSIMETYLKKQNGFSQHFLHLNILPD